MWIQISDIYLGIYIGFIIHSFSRVVSISFLPEALQKASELGESEGGRIGGELFLQRFARSRALYMSVI